MRQPESACYPDLSHAEFCGPFDPFSDRLPTGGPLAGRLGCGPGGGEPSPVSEPGDRDGGMRVGVCRGGTSMRTPDSGSEAHNIGSGDDNS